MIGDPAPARTYNLAVFPVRDRVPADPYWPATVTTDPDPARWPPGATLAVSCRASGVVVLDLDHHPGHADGRQVLAELAAGRTLPPTLTVTTPRGGSHLYYRPPAGWWIGSGALADGIDVRGPGRRSGGYVLAPGAITTAGRYTITTNAPIAALPAWLIPHLPGRRGG